MISREFEHPSMDELRLRRNIAVYASRRNLKEISSNTDLTAEKARSLTVKYVGYQFETARASLDLAQKAHIEGQEVDFCEKEALVMCYIKFSYLIHDIKEGNYDFVKEVFEDVGNLFNEYGAEVVGDGMLRLSSAISESSVPVLFPATPWEDMKVVRDYAKSRPK